MVAHVVSINSYNLQVYGEKFNFSYILNIIFYVFNKKVKLSILVPSTMYISPFFQLFPETKPRLKK